MEPPKVSKRPSAQDVEVAARNLPSGKNKGAPERPPSENNRPKPNPARTRVWSDRTGQFKVEAEFLGMNGNKLRLHKMNGVIIEVPIEKMSHEDAAMIRKHLARREKHRSSAPPDDDDVPLAKTQPRRPSQQVSYESQHRRERSQRPPKQHFDWFAFFLDAGCDVDDCTRYASNFDRDRIDESILGDLDAPTMRSLGLREGDVIRVRKAIQAKYGKKTPEQQTQIDQDEEYARKLQEQENAGKAPAAPAPGLFTGPDGKLANNTRRGRPERKNTGVDSVDGAALSAATEQLSKTSISPTPAEPVRNPSPPPAAPTPPPPATPEKEVDLLKEEPPKPKFSFDDDAWTIKPAAKPASPAPPPISTPSPAPAAKANSTDALLAQIQSMRPTATGPPPGGSEMVEAAQAGVAGRADLQRQASNMPPPSAYGLGAGNNTTPMSQLQQQQQQQQQLQPQMTAMNAPRGPLAPVASNEALLNPLQPARTGFVPTHQTANNMMPQQTGYMSPMSPPGMSPGMSPGFGQQPMQPAYTGFPGFQQQPQNSSFNAVAGMQAPPPSMPQQQQSGGGDQFAPSNIFSAMKRTDFSKNENENPQPSNKYDALRPLTTGYNGSMQQPMQTGMMMQPTGMMGNNMGMMGMQQTGMMGMGPQMTGYNPYMQQQQQNPFGY